MELSKSILKAVEDLIGYHVTMSNVAEVKECGDTFDHIWGDISDNCSKINLYVGSAIQRICNEKKVDV